MGKMTINGAEYDVPAGASVNIVDGIVKINGQSVTTYQQPVQLIVNIEGDVNVVNAAGSVHVTGNVGAYVKADGSVSIGGSAKGPVQAGSSVTCGDVATSVQAGSSVKCGKVGGSISAGSSVRHG